MLNRIGALGINKSGRLDSNQRPHGPEPCALPTEPRPDYKNYYTSFARLWSNILLPNGTLLFSIIRIVVEKADKRIVLVNQYDGRAQSSVGEFEAHYDYLFTGANEMCCGAVHADDA